MWRIGKRKETCGNFEQKIIGVRVELKRKSNYLNRISANVRTVRLHTTWSRSPVNRQIIASIRPFQRHISRFSLWNRWCSRRRHATGWCQLRAEYRNLTIFFSNSQMWKKKGRTRGLKKNKINMKELLMEVLRPWK